MNQCSVEIAVGEVQRDLEIVLQTRFGLEHLEDAYRDYTSQKIREWRGVLSTDPAKVRPQAYYLCYESTPPEEVDRIFSDCIRNKCRTISRELGICLLEAGIDVISGFNGAPRNNLYPPSIIMPLYSQWDDQLEMA